MFLETPEEDLEEVYLSENFFSLLEGQKSGKDLSGKSWGPVAMRRWQGECSKRCRIPNRPRGFCV